jgi:hypothetical protein
VLLVVRRKLQGRKLIRLLREETEERMWSFVVYILFRFALLIFNLNVLNQLEQSGISAKVLSILNVRLHLEQ